MGDVMEKSDTNSLNNTVGDHLTPEQAQLLKQWATSSGAGDHDQSVGKGGRSAGDELKSPERQQRTKNEQDAVGETAVDAAKKAAKQVQSVDEMDSAKVNDELQRRKKAGRDTTRQGDDGNAKQPESDKKRSQTGKNFNLSSEIGQIMRAYRDEMTTARETSQAYAKYVRNTKPNGWQDKLRESSKRERRLLMADRILFQGKHGNDPELALAANKIAIDLAADNVAPENFPDVYLDQFDAMMQERKKKRAAERKNGGMPDSAQSKLDDLSKWEKSERDKEVRREEDFVQSDISNYKITSGYDNQSRRQLAAHDDYPKFFGPLNVKLGDKPLTREEIKGKIGAAIKSPDAVGSDVDVNLSGQATNTLVNGSLPKFEAMMNGIATPNDGPMSHDEFMEAKRIHDLIQSRKFEQQVKQEGYVSSRPDHDSLTAISIDRTVDVQRLSQAEAQRRLNAELEANTKGKGLFDRAIGGLKNMWKGNLWRGYYETKYQQETAKQLSVVEGGDLSDNDIEKRSQTDPRYALVLRMIRDNDQYIRTAAGESRQLIDPTAINKQLENKDLTPEKRAELERQKESYNQIKEAIAKFSTKNQDGTGYLMDEQAFNDAISRADAALHGDTDESVRAKLSNYMAIVKYVRGRTEHADGVKQIMEGFRLYAAESRSGVNGEVKMGKVAALAERLNRNKVFRIVPLEVTAAVASMAFNAAPIVARSAAKAVPILGSMAVTGFLAGAREAANISKDRATLERQLAEGGQNVDNRMNQKLAETMYNTVSASDLSSRIDEVIKSGEPNAMQALLTDIIVRQEIGDRRGIDLISYSDPNQVDNERASLMTKSLELEAATITALKAEASERGRQFNNNVNGFRRLVSRAVDLMDGLTSDEVDKLQKSTKNDPIQRLVVARYKDIFDKDEKFNEIKRKAAIRQGRKAAMFAGVAGVAAQEFMAAFNPNVHGVVDAIRGNADDSGAHDTLLTGSYRAAGNFAKQFGMNLPGIDDVASPSMAPNTDAIKQLRPQMINHDLTPEEVAKYKAQGYDVDRIVTQVHEQSTESVPVDQAVSGNADFHRAGWFNNNTLNFDHNELSTYRDGSSMTFNPIGESWSGDSILSSDQIQQMGANGQIRLMLSPTAETQGKPFEVVGKLVNGQIQFNPEPGSPAAEMIANHSYKFAEVVDANNMVIGTDIGSGVSGTLTTTVDKLVDKVSYELTASASTEATPVVEKAPTLFDMPAAFPIPFGRRNLRNTVQPDRNVPAGTNAADNGGETPDDNQTTTVIPPVDDSKQWGIASDQNPMQDATQNVLAASDIANRVMDVEYRPTKSPQTVINLDDLHPSSDAKAATDTAADTAKKPGVQLDQQQSNSNSGFASRDEALASMREGLGNPDLIKSGNWWNGMIEAMNDGRLDSDDINKLALPGTPNKGDNANLYLEQFRINAIKSGKLSDNDVNQLSYNGGDYVCSAAIQSGQLAHQRLEEIAKTGSNRSRVLAREALYSASAATQH